MYIQPLRHWNASPSSPCTPSITTTTFFRRSPSILASSSLLHHGTAPTHLSLIGFLRTVLVSQTPRRFHTMSSFVVAFTLKHTPSSLVLANFPSGLPLASFSTVHPPRASCPPSPTSPFQSFIRSLPVMSRFKSRQQESRVLRDPRPKGMFDSPSFLRRTSNRSDHSLGRSATSLLFKLSIDHRPHHTPRSCSSVRVRCPTARKR